MWLPVTPGPWCSPPRRSATRSSEQVELLIATVLGCLSDAPPELAQDIIYEGIHLLGGGARLRGLAQRLAEETDVPVHMVDDPLECVVRGAGLCLDSFDSLRPIFAAAES